MNDLRIYVASLADYNAGRLHGVWIDVEGKDVDELQAEVNAMLAESEEDAAEEYAIHDYEEFGSLLEEYTPLDEVVRLAEIAEELGEEWPAYVAFAEYAAIRPYPDVSEFQDHYMGEWYSKLAFAENFVENTGFFDGVHGQLVRYFDYEAYARDLFLDGFNAVDSGNGSIYVFMD